MDEAAVTGQMGKPAARHPLPDGGMRLVFPRGPVGKETYMVDLGPDGRVRSWKQALTPQQFELVVPGVSTQTLLFELGPPADRRLNGPTGGEIWSYRFPTYECRWFQIELNPIGRVVRASYEAEPSCASYL
jgi:hypothetical protein